ncbi:hypothetical protein ACP4OV_001800 [Aristida adscensionis]
MRIEGGREAAAASARGGGAAAEEAARRMARGGQRAAAVVGAARAPLRRCCCSPRSPPRRGGGRPRRRARARLFRGGGGGGGERRTAAALRGRRGRRPRRPPGGCGGDDPAAAAPMPRRTVADVRHPAGSSATRLLRSRGGRDSGQRCGGFFRYRVVAERVKERAASSLRALVGKLPSYSTQSATDQCSRTRTAKYSLSSEESDYISSHLALDGGKDDTESLAPFIVSERIYDEHVNLDHTIKGDSERFADNAKQESASEKDNDATGRHCDDFVCGRESVCSSCEEPRYALNGKGSDMSSEECSGSTQRHETGQKLQIVPEDTMNMIEPSTNEDVTGITGLNHDHDEQLHSHDQNSRGTHRKVQMVPEDMMNMVEPITNKDVTGITELNHDHDEQLHSHDQSSGSTHRPNAEQGPVISEIEDGSTSREPNPEFSTMNQVVPPEVHQDTLQSEDKLVKSEDISKNFIAQKREDDAPKSGKGVLKSVAGGITLVGAVFFIVLRRSKERSFTAVIPSLSDKNQRDSRAKNNDERKAAAVYPGEWLKV